MGSNYLPILDIDQFLLNYSGDLNTKLRSLVFKWSKVVRSLNGPLFECHLNTGLNFVRYSDYHLNTEQVKVCYSDVRYSDPHCTMKANATSGFFTVLLYCKSSTCLGLETIGYLNYDRPKARIHLVAKTNHSVFKYLKILTFN